MTRRQQAFALERQARKLERGHRWKEAAEVWDVAGDAWAEAGDAERSRQAYESAWGRRQFGVDWLPVRVIFRRYPEGDVVALLVDYPERDGLETTLFTAEGHGSAHHGDVIWATRAAKPSEYAYLASMMRGRGYGVTPITRFPQRRRYR